MGEEAPRQPSLIIKIVRMEWARRVDSSPFFARTTCGRWTAACGKIPYWKGFWQLRVIKSMSVFTCGEIPTVCDSRDTRGRLRQGPFPSDG